MGTYFPPLNLSLDADERAVKRAYAAALKRTRPDDDPAAFQALVAARDRALDWVRRRADVRPMPSFGDLIAPSLEPQPMTSPPAMEPVMEPPNSKIEPAYDVPDWLRKLAVVDVRPIVAEAPQSDEDTATIVELPPAPTAIPIARFEAEPSLESGPSFASIIRSQQISRQFLSAMAVELIRDEANGKIADAGEPGLAGRWDVLLANADDLDLSGRMALERTIVIELDTVMQQAAAGTPQVERFAATVLTLDRAFHWSQDPRRVVRLLGEPSTAHPLVFAIERFGENAVRLRMSPGGFPIIPDGDLVAWFGSIDHATVKSYRAAQKVERMGFSWSWYAFLSPPSWCVRTGLSLWGIGLAAAAILAVYVLFDPIANVGTANSFATFLALLMAGRVAIGVAARTLETSKLVSVIKRIEDGPLPSLADRRRQIASAHGPKLLNVIVGLCFLLLVDGYCLALIIPAMDLRPARVAEMVVVPDRKTPGVTFADRLVAQSYLDQAREIAESFDDLLRANRAEPFNPLRRARIEALRQSFLSYIKELPIGDYAAEFDRFRHEIAQLQRRD
jgi:hypothetical protein